MGGGTSAASPGVAGIAALYLQKNPTATAMDVKNAIITCTTVDGFTGVVPNNQYGYGKANAFNALVGCTTTILDNSEASNAFLIYPNPSQSGNTITISLSNNIKKVKTEVFIYNSLGQLITKEQMTSSTVILKELSAGMYFCKLVQDGRIIATEKMIIL